MVFLVGPRQSGKTWLARRIAGSFRDSAYLNYDSLDDKRIIEKGAWMPESRLLVLDEIHKMTDWKNRLKGMWDTRPAGQRFLITGSARLDTERQSGESMAGRFVRHRLLPFTPAELTQMGESPSLDRLLERGGFPEPFLAENGTEAERWRSLYVDGLIHEDVPELERIADLRAMRTVLSMLRERVGSPVSFSSVSRDVGVSPNTVMKYVAALESLFIVFLVTPFSRKIGRSLLKEPKIYFFDAGMVRGEPGQAFENLAALEGEDTELHYIRTKDGEEVDFCLTRAGTAELFLEAKLSDDVPSRSLRRFHERHGVPAIQLVKDLKNDRAADWLSRLRE